MEPTSRIQFFPLPEALAQQADTYVATRDQESRLLPDGEVRNLPKVPASHPYYQEWKARHASLTKAQAHLQQVCPASRVLDLGCGNGWMSHALAMEGFEVWGIDVNTPEVEQAHRVFQHPQLHWGVGNIQADLPLGPFEAIVISAALQYFPDPAALVRHLSGYLSPGGGILVMDTFLYAPEQVAAAKQRSKAYFTQLGTPEMAAHYHHHGWEWLEDFPHQIIYRPGWKQKVQRHLGKVTSPFPMVWVQPV